MEVLSEKDKENESTYPSSQLPAPGNSAYEKTFNKCPHFRERDKKEMSCETAFLLLVRIKILDQKIFLDELFWL